MKKFGILMTSLCFAAVAATAQTADYTRGLSIWFDKPCDLSSYALWNSLLG